MSVTFLFDSTVIASEVAFQMQGKYDGCNSVTFDSEFEDLDLSGIKFVVDSLGGDFCLLRTFCFYKSRAMDQIIDDSKITTTCGTKIEFNPDISKEIVFKGMTNEQIHLAKFATNGYGKSTLTLLPPFIAAINTELERLGWSTEQAKEYVMSKYNKLSRQLLDESEIIELWQDLRKM